MYDESGAAQLEAVMRRLVRKVIDMKKMLFGILLILLIAACSPAKPQSTTTQVLPKDTIAPPTVFRVRAYETN